MALCMWYVPSVNSRVRRCVSALPEMVFAVNEERLQRTGIQHYVLSSNSFDNFLSQFQDANPVRAGGDPPPPPLRFGDS